MRFAMASVDRYLGVYHAFENAGWTLDKLFTVAKDSDSGNQERIIAAANAAGASVQLSRLVEEDLLELRAFGCEALIVASYPWRIPDWRPYLRHAINFHASPLPEGRGPYPFPQAILSGQDRWGVTCHILTHHFDAGDILAADHFPLDPDECHETLDLKIQMSARRLAERMVGDFDALWRDAKPPGVGSYWALPTMEDRLIDCHAGVEAILRHSRAFGDRQTLVTLGEECMVVGRAAGWTETHSQPVGTIVHVFNRSMVIAVADGFVALLDCERADEKIQLALRLSQASNDAGS